MTSPNIDLDPNEVWAHAQATKARAADYHTPYPPGVNDGGWPSEQAYSDAHSSMQGAGKAFGDRQNERGTAVKAAADGLTGEDFDASKMMQGVGAIIGPIMQSMASVFQGLGVSQGLSAGAQALSGMLSSGGSLLGNVFGKLTPAAGTAAVGAGAGTGLAAGASGSGGGGGGGAGTTPAAATSRPPTNEVGHTSPPKDKRDEGERVIPAAVPMVGGMGMGGMPLAAGGSSSPPNAKPVTARIETDDEPPTGPILIPVTAQALVREA